MQDDASICDMNDKDNVLDVVSDKDVSNLYEQNVNIDVMSVIKMFLIALKFGVCGAY